MIFNHIKDVPAIGETVIRYKEYYLHVLETDKGLEIAWSREQSLMQDIPVREYWTALPPEPPENEGDTDGVHS